MEPALCDLHWCLSITSPAATVKLDGVQAPTIETDVDEKRIAVNHWTVECVNLKAVSKALSLWERGLGRAVVPQRTAAVMTIFSRSQQNTDVERPVRFTLWIDGVGAYLLCLGDRVTFGGPEFDGKSADIALLANLSRQHATLSRTGEGYLLEAHATVSLAGRPVVDRMPTNADCSIELGGGVQLHFRLPTALSATAVLDFVSDHRPAHSVDGIILMHETCLLGPGRECHIHCPDWSETVVLFLRGDAFRCKSRSDLFVDGTRLGEDDVLCPGDVVTGTELRFHLEALDETQAT